MTSESGAASAFDRSHPTEGQRALEKERSLPLTGWQQEVDQAHRFGLEAADSIVDRNLADRHKCDTRCDRTGLS